MTHRHIVPNKITFNLDDKQKVKLKFILSEYEGQNKEDIYKAIANKGIDPFYVVLGGPKIDD